MRSGVASLLAAFFSQLPPSSLFWFTVFEVWSSHSSAHLLPLIKGNNHSCLAVRSLEKQIQNIPVSSSWSKLIPIQSEMILKNCSKEFKSSLLCPNIQLQMDHIEVASDAAGCWLLRAGTRRAHLPGALQQLRLLILKASGDTLPGSECLYVE